MHLYSVGPIGTGAVMGILRRSPSTRRC